MRWAKGPMWRRKNREDEGPWAGQDGEPGPPAAGCCSPGPADSATAGPGRAPAGSPAAPPGAAAGPAEPPSRPPAWHSVGGWGGVTLLCLWITLVVADPKMQFFADPATNPFLLEK